MGGGVWLGKRMATAHLQLRYVKALRKHFADEAVHGEMTVRLRNEPIPEQVIAFAQLSQYPVRPHGSFRIALEPAMRDMCNACHAS